ncbi:MAG: DNA-directed RNA polymerase subunit omega [Alphaproteobacteria bacterium]
MARVTVEDCIDVIPNRFELVMLAAQRAKDLAAGAMVTLPRDNDKNPVLALREIGAQHVSVEALREESIRTMQRNISLAEDEEELEALLAGESSEAPTRAASILIESDDLNAEDFAEADADLPDSTEDDL